MSKADAFLNFKPVPVKPPAASGAGAAPAKTLAGYKLVRQEQTQWCWAALTLAVADFYGKHDWTQGKLVNVERGRDDACNKPVPPAANMPWYVSKALKRAGHYADKKKQHKLTFEQAKAEIDADRPLCIRIGWKGGGGHFVGVYGYDEGGSKLLNIGDPWSGEALVAFDTFPDTYEHGGAWSWSYWTVKDGESTDEKEAAAARKAMPPSKPTPPDGASASAQEN